MRQALLVPALCAVACGGPAGPATQPEPGSRGFTGRITFDARTPTPQGTSEAVEVRPARHVDVALVGPTGEIVSEGAADADGAYRLEGPADATAVRVYARVRARGHDIAIARDASGRETHYVDLPIAEGDAPVDLHATDRTGDGGAFHVVDTLLRGLDAATTWAERPLPPLYVYWLRGGTREWSFYRGERPVGSGRFALELLGGEPGQASTTDTDEHDEAIVLHELGHFVMDQLSGDSSTGGMHPTGARIEPGLAWEEGRATWFALAVLGAPIYQDTIGVQPWGRLRVDEDLERVPGEDDVTGLGSETAVSRVLWDLTDGGDGPPDQDGDGVSVGAATILRAMMAQWEQPGAYPSLPSFLVFLAESGAIGRSELEAMLRHTGQPPETLLPASPADVWPPVVPVGATVTGRIDGATQPAPSGGFNLPQTGFDAIHTYRIHVEETGMLVLRLTIAGTGRVADHTDLDLELLDRRADRLADSRTEDPQETVAHLVEPGWYVGRVRDGGRGNVADYRLEVLLETLGGPPIR